MTSTRRPRTTTTSSTPQIPSSESHASPSGRRPFGPIRSNFCRRKRNFTQTLPDDVRRRRPGLPRNLQVIDSKFVANVARDATVSPRNGILRAWEVSGATSNGGEPGITWYPAGGCRARIDGGGAMPPHRTRCGAVRRPSILRSTTRASLPDGAVQEIFGECRRSIRPGALAPCPSHTRRRAGVDAEAVTPRETGRSPERPV